MLKQKRILVADEIRGGKDEQKRSLAIRTVAKSMAKALRTEIDLIFVDDFQSYPVSDSPYEFLLKNLEQKSKFSQNKPADMSLMFLHGNTVEKILEVANQRNRYELLVIGTHGRKGLYRALIGSVAEEVLRNAKIPVLVVGKESLPQACKMKKIDHALILLPTDLGKNSARAEEYALHLAKKLRGRILLLHCLYESLHPVIQNALLSSEGVRRLASYYEGVKLAALEKLKLRAKFFKRHGISCEYTIEDRLMCAGDAIAVCQSKTKASLLVMGTHGRNLLYGAFFGATARQVVLESKVPIVVVKSRG